MEKFLVAIPYHVYDYEISEEEQQASTGVFIYAENESKALNWAENIAERLFLSENPGETENWKSFGYHCWIENDIKNSGWSHCLDFFQSVEYGNYPDFDKMGTNAYVEWADNNGLYYGPTKKRTNILKMIWAKLTSSFRIF